ncbi:hypothetical protein SRHO_G00312290 [Serrasalmus rhombeus]
MLADLRIAVVPVQDGLQAQRCADLAMVLKEISAPRYWYSLDFVNMGPSSITQALFDKAREGFCENPTIFSQAMSANSAKFTPPRSSQILLYVYDILLASPDEDSCWTDTVALLHFLVENGHKAEGELKSDAAVEPRGLHKGHKKEVLGRPTVGGTISTTKPTIPPGVLALPGNYTCFSRSSGWKIVTKLPWCAYTTDITTNTGGYQSEWYTTHTIACDDLCGDRKLRAVLPQSWQGSCALVQFLMPFHIYPTAAFSTLPEKLKHHHLAGALITTCGCCLIPCARGLSLRLIDSAVTKVMLYKTITTEEPGCESMLPMERCNAVASGREVEEPNL